LRHNGMLLDVPRFARAPVIDGRLDDDAWEKAATADTFYQLSSAHVAAIVSPVRSRLYLGYTDEAFYVGFYEYDETPEELMIRAKNRDDYVWWEDVIEIFMDTDFDHLGYAQIGITSVPVVADNWYPEGFVSDDASRRWNADYEVSTYVGQDFWSVEYEVRFVGPQITQPNPGSIWGFNPSRTYRNTEYAQWVRMSRAHAPNELGLLRFE